MCEIQFTTFFFSKDSQNYMKALLKFFVATQNSYLTKRGVTAFSQKFRRGTIMKL